MDIDKLHKGIETWGVDKVAYIRLEAGTNLIGGQPFSMQNLREVSAIAKSYDGGQNARALRHGGHIAWTLPQDAEGSTLEACATRGPGMLPGFEPHQRMAAAAQVRPAPKTTSTM